MLTRDVQIGDLLVVPKLIWGSNAIGDMIAEDYYIGIVVDIDCIIMGKPFILYVWCNLPTDFDAQSKWNNITFVYSAWKDLLTIVNDSCYAFSHC